MHRLAEIEIHPQAEQERVCRSGKGMKAEQDI
jgi:hypothetical protein